MRTRESRKKHQSLQREYQRASMTEEFYNKLFIKRMTFGDICQQTIMAYQMLNKEIGEIKDIKEAQVDLLEKLTLSLRKHKELGRTLACYQKELQQLTYSSQYSEEEVKMKIKEKQSQQRLKCLKQQRLKLRQQYQKVRRQIQAQKGQVRIYGRLYSKNIYQNICLSVIPGNKLVFEEKVQLSTSCQINRVQQQFHQIFPVNFSQADIFSVIQRDLSEVLLQKSICLFSFGQSGSGKTYSLDGSAAFRCNARSSEDEAGIVYRSVKYLLQCLYSKDNSSNTYKLCLSVLEFKEDGKFDIIKQLKNKKSQNTKSKFRFANMNTKEEEDQIQIEQLDQFLKVYQKCQKLRSIKATGMNLNSSRSHFIQILKVRKDNNLEGNIAFIDLAGLEDASKISQEDRDSNRFINNTISSIKVVINSMVQQKKLEILPFKKTEFDIFFKSYFTGETTVILLAGLRTENSQIRLTKRTLEFVNEIAKVEMKK